MKKLIPKWLIWTIAIVAFVGLIDASYLTAVHYKGAELGCDAWGSCNEVTTSKYSEIFGIPLSLLGSLYYLTILGLALIYIDSKWKYSLKLIPIATTFGFLFSIYLVVIQLFILNAICLYCMFSALTSTTLFVLSMIYVFTRPSEQEGTYQ